jgi:hypothetical protein
MFRGWNKDGYIGDASLSISPLGKQKFCLANFACLLWIYLGQHHQLSPEYITPQNTTKKLFSQP